MAHPFDNHQFRPWNRFSRIDATFHRHQRVGIPMNDQGRHGDGLERFFATARGKYGSQLPCCSRWTQATIEGPPGVFSDASFIKRQLSTEHLRYSH